MTTLGTPRLMAAWQRPLHRAHAKLDEILPWGSGRRSLWAALIGLVLSLGILGITDLMNVPFSTTNYTAELIENQQARSVADGLEADVITMNQHNDIDVLHTRGGLVPAALVARELEIRLIDTICLASYGAAGGGGAEQPVIDGLAQAGAGGDQDHVPPPGLSCLKRRELMGRQDEDSVGGGLEVVDLLLQVLHVAPQRRQLVLAHEAHPTHGPIDLGADHPDEHLAVVAAGGDEVVGQLLHLAHHVRCRQRLRRQRHPVREQAGDGILRLAGGRLGES